MEKATRRVIATLMAVFALCTSELQAQDQAEFHRTVKGQNLINLGIGVGTFGFAGTGGLPIVGSVERGLTDKISAGLYGGFIKRKFGTDLTYSYVVAGAKGSYHFNEYLNIENAKLDVYGGAALYYRGFKIKYKDHEDPEYNQKASGGNLGIGLFAGGRYFFSPQAGAFVEIGYGVAPLQLGVTFKV